MQASRGPSASGPAGSVPVFRLPASLELTGADALHATFLSWVRDERDIVIDGSGVERVSTACLQVLVAAHASAGVHGVRFKIQAMSDILAGAVADLDLGGSLGLAGAP